jgi:hypothetical protein
MAKLHVSVSTLVAAIFCAVISLLFPAGSNAAEPPTDFAAAAAKAAAARRAAQPAGNVKSSDEVEAEIVAQEEKLDHKHRVWTQEFKQRSFEWHLLSSRIIFGLVIFIVCFGLLITYMQFRKDYTDVSYHQTQPRGVEAKPAEGDPAAIAAAVPSKSVTSLKLGPGGLELSSQIIGLAVLAFSLGFFYLYVKNVYPMTEAGVAASAEKAEAQSKAAASK